MKIKKCLIKRCFIILVIVLLFSTIGTAQENNTNTEKAKVLVISKDIGLEKESNKYVVLLNITTNKIGHLIYIEEYYVKNDTGKLKLDIKRLYYNNTLKNNTIILRIKRPLNNGDQYDAIKAVAYIDNKRELNAWFKYPEKKKASPGFEVIIPILTISIIYLIKRENNKEK